MSPRYPNNGRTLDEGSDEDLAIELQELLALTNNHTTSRTRPSPSPRHRLPQQQRRQRRCLVGVLCLVVLLVLVVPRDSTDSRRRRWRRPTPAELVQCPPTVTISSVNTDDEVFFHDYIENGTQPLMTSDEEFLSTFRDSEFDGWDYPFWEFQERLRDWKTQAFVPHLRNGDSIYESACGIGLNLYATLELLQQQGNLSDLTVYGNEYVPVNVGKAIHLLDVLVQHQPNVTYPNHVGSICQADSTNLSHIPDNTFDLVFTGYLSPLWDPLELNQGFSENYVQMRKICRDPRAEDLVQEMQRKQEAWHSKWVMEMIRIAKPDAPVIVEEISLPYCSMINDWGGVSKEFWETGAEQYGWDVDPEATFFGKRSHRPIGRRYMVHLQKNKAAT